jgi:TorA maturation chaperone TorD
MTVSSSGSEQPVNTTQHLRDISLLYRFLGQSLKFPEASWFTADFRKTFSVLLNQLGAAQEVLELEQSFSDSTDLLEELQIEYTRLFINGVPHVAAPPYASVYLDKSLQGVHASRTLAYYREKGCDMSVDSDLPDHIVHELEFLSHLVEDGDQEGEREFLQRFFLPWFPDFRDRVLSEANHPYYRLVITMIDYFTKEEE